MIALVPGGAAERSGKVKVGDDLVAVTGIKMIGAKYERILFDARRWDFDTVVDAIQSNTPSFGCEGITSAPRTKTDRQHSVMRTAHIPAAAADVILQFQSTSEA